MVFFRSSMLVTSYLPVINVFTYDCHIEFAEEWVNFTGKFFKNFRARRKL